MSEDRTVVLVHGALSDASIWAGVSARLHAEGVEVLAPAMPMRSLQGDVEYLTDFIKSIEGPVVVAGHSYGGTVISHPSFNTEQVEALVFVSAFQPDSGEATGELNARFPGSLLGEPRVVIRPRRDGNDLYLRPEFFAEVYAADVDPDHVRVMAAAQRPVEVDVLSESFEGSPSWAGKPSWAFISTTDNSLPVQTMRFMAERAGSQIVEAESSHASPVSSAGAVADLIGTALAATR